MRKDPRERLFAIAEEIRKAGADGLSEGRIAWQFKIAASTMRTDYRRVLLDVFRDLRFEDGIYRSDPTVEAQLIVAAVRSTAPSTGGAE